MKTLTESRKFLTVLGVLLALQFLWLFLMDTDFATLLMVFFVEAVLLVLALWIDARNLNRHSQLLKRIARASTRPEINQLKWQLAERDQQHFEALLTESRNTNKGQHSLMQDLQEVANVLEALQSASAQIDTNRQSLHRIQNELSTVPQLSNELRMLRQQLHEIETAPRHKRLHLDIERSSQEQRTIKLEIERLKTLVNEIVVALDMHKTYSS